MRSAGDFFPTVRSRAAVGGNTYYFDGEALEMADQPRPRPTPAPNAGYAIWRKRMIFAALAVPSFCSGSIINAQVLTPGLVASSEASPITQLSLQEFVRRVLKANKAVQTKRNEQELADSAVERAQSVFQPKVDIAASSGRSRVQNTLEEDLLRQRLGLFERKGQDYSVGVNGLVASGAKLEVKGTVSRFLTNINESLRGSDASDFRTFYGVTVTQPLARDAGREVTRSRVKIAELDADAARKATIDTEASTAADALFAYLDLGLAQVRMTGWSEKIKVAEQLSADAKSLVRLGRLSESDIWEVQNNLARYRAGASEALQAKIERINRMRGLMLLSAADGWSPLRASDPIPQVSQIRLDIDEDLLVAVERRSDYRLRKLMVEREGVQVVFAQNQKLPRIDLLASYGQNGLAQALRAAVSPNNTGDFPTWSIGLQMSMPIGENQQASADLRAARARAQEALLALKSVESTLANDIDTSHAMIRSSYERYQLFAEIAEREARLTQVLRQKLIAGRSDMRELLVSQERAINSRIAMHEQAVAHAKALTIRALAQGILLDQFQ